MGRHIVIDPITRLEGHGKIRIDLDGSGTVSRTRLQAPDFRGFEKFCEGRAAEEMPTLTPKICGVCPIAHHIASAKALDDLFGITPPATARKIRELIHNAFVFEDHLLHFYVLGGPDWLVGPGTDVRRRNLFGVAEVLGAGAVAQFMEMRQRVRDLQAELCGSALFPVCALPGGVSKPVDEALRLLALSVSRDAVEFAELTLARFRRHVLGDRRYTGLLTAEAMVSRIHSMGLTDDDGRVNFYEGQLRVVDPHGRQLARFAAARYADYLAERVEPDTYQKIVYLKKIGWKGYADGTDSGIVRVGPLGRLNAASAMATPRAQAEYERWVGAFGGKPVHHVFAYHWARLIEVLYAAERMCELTGDPTLTDGDIRRMPAEDPREGIGLCEAPRGTLIHHYVTDHRAMLKRVHLLVATQHNAAAIVLSLDRAARVLLADGNDSPERRNVIEMVFRAYDPCMACATH